MAQSPESPELKNAPDPISLMMDRLTSLSVAKQISLLISIAAVVGLVLFLFTWSSDEEMVPAPVSQDPQTMQKAIDLLEQQGIDYRMERNQILIPKDKYFSVRLKLATAGLVGEEEKGGYALLDRDQGFGLSHFRERVQNKRALEGELAATIAQMRGIRKAKVLLALPEPTVFVRERRKASASVHLTLQPGFVPDDELAQSIAYIVSSAVPNLDPADIKIVDNRGRTLYDGKSDISAVNLKKLKYQREVEREKRNRILSLLTPIVGGAGHVRAEVTADFDFTRQETTRETYEPDPMAIRSEQIVKEEDGIRKPQGIPGALTNQPPRAGIAPETGYTGAQDDKTDAKRRREQTVRNYELDRTITHIKGEGAVLRKLQVAVVLDTRWETDPKTGEKVRKPRTQEELDRIRKLVINAVGAQLERGDSITVAEEDFRHDTSEEEQVAWWTEPWFIELVKQALVVLAVLLIVFFVIRPLVHELTRPDEVVSIEYPQELEEEQEGDEDEPETIEEIHEALNQLDVSLEQAAMDALEETDEGAELIEKVRTIVQNDPKMVAHILRSWLEEEEEEDNG